MKLSQLLESSRKILQENNIESYKIDSIAILCHELNLTKEAIIFDKGRDLTQNQIKKVQNSINRRIKREPVAKIIGKKPFFEDDFIVSQDVLDPRPDSETIINEILNIFSQNQKDLDILELGVGSGCLILTILKKLNNSKGIAVDINKKSLEIAKENAKNLNLENKIKFINSDWFSNLDKEKFDIIISNPPYIKSSDITNLQEEVQKFDPLIALDGGIDGLDCYKIIAKDIKNFLKKDGYLFLEIGQNQENDIIEIFEEKGLKFLKSEKDLGQIIRCLTFKNADI